MNTQSRPRKVAKAAAQVSVQTVFVIDDDAAVRDSLRWLLESIRLRIETFDSAESFLKVIDAERRGCIVLDVRMPGFSGPELMEKLGRLGVALPIIFLSAHGDVPLAVRVMKAGAFDFLQKPYNNQQFIERVSQALQQDSISRSERQRHDHLANALARLTARERQILDLVVAGNSNKQVARALDLSHKTIEAHRSHLMQKLNVSSFAELLQLVLTQGDPKPH